MKNLNIFFYEWKHFSKSPFKVLAVLLFLIASLYGLYNGASLYNKQMEEVEKIEQKVEDEKQKYITQYEEGNLTPEDRPWIDMSSPFWAIWYNPSYHIKTPSPALVYSIGQAEQYGFYKRITFWASPYDADMAEEIANPERLQTGTLDFSFALIFLLPLLLLILTYNLKSSESEQGFLPLVEVQSASKYGWLNARLLFYLALCATLLIVLLVFGAKLTGVFKSTPSAFLQMIAYGLLYLLFWGILYYFILRKGQRILENTLKMIGLWFLFAFIIPAAVHQVISIKKPANLMTDFIEVRDKQQELYDGPDSVFQQKLIDLYPEIENSPVFKDSTKINLARNQSAAALVNELKKESIAPIEKESQQKNNLVRSSYLFNPVTFFQNKLNQISETHYDDYQKYRDEIQMFIDKKIDILVEDLWKDVKVDKETYINYGTKFKI